MKVAKTQEQRVQVHYALCRKYGLRRPRISCLDIWPECIRRDWKRRRFGYKASPPFGIAKTNQPN